MIGGGEWQHVGTVAMLTEDECTGISVQGRELALYRVGENWFCTDNICTHEFALLTDGFLDGHVIECPLHGGKFDIRSGKRLSPPIEKDIVSYPVRIVDDEVFVNLGPSVK